MIPSSPGAAPCDARGFFVVYGPAMVERDMTRREFVGGCAAALSAPALAGAAPELSEYRRGGMTYRRLGRTDLFPSLLSFGSHTDPADRVKAPNGTVLTEAGQARRDRIIAHAFDLGVNLLDVYANEGQWEPAARMVRERRSKMYDFAGARRLRRRCRQCVQAFRPCGPLPLPHRSDRRRSP